MNRGKTFQSQDYGVQCDSFADMHEIAVRYNISRNLEYHPIRCAGRGIVHNASRALCV